MQVAARAACASITVDSIWDHFINAIVPAINSLQSHYVTSDQAESSNLGKLLNQALNHASKSDEEMSEV